MAPLVAEVQNPVKKYAYSIIVDGLLGALAQKVTIPVTEIESVEHGNYNMNAKTAGKLKYGDMTIEKLVDADAGQQETWGMSWLRTAQDPTGTGLPAPLYKKVVVINQFDPTGLVVVRQWTCYGCWVKKVEPGELDATSGENVMEKVTLSVDYMV